MASKLANDPSIPEIATIPDDHFTFVLDSATGKFKRISGADLKIFLAAYANANRGVADTSTNPGDVPTVAIYTATEAGTYTHFLDSGGNPIVIEDEDLVNHWVMLTVTNNITTVTSITLADLSAYYSKIEADNVFFKNANINQDSGKNLQNPANKTTGQWINYLNGSLVTLSGAIMYYTPVTAGQQYTLSGYHHPNYASNIVLCIRFENASNGLISFAILNENSPYTFTAPAGCVRVYYGVYRPDRPADYSQIQLEAGATATSYEAYYSYVSGINSLDILAKKIAGNSTIVNETENETSPASKGWILDKGYGVPDLQSSRNLQNPANKITGQFINQANGAIVTLAGGIMYYCPVTAGQQYTLSGYHHPDYAASKRLAIRFENASNELIAYVIPNSDDSPYTFTAPANCVRVLYSVYRSDTPKDYSQIQLEAGATATSYEAYYPGKVIGINGYPLSGEEAADVDVLTIANSDKIAITGCSYTAGQGTSVQGKSWIALLSLFTNYALYNFGVGGSRLTDIANRIRTNTASRYTTRGYGVKDIKPRFTVINNIGNETSNFNGVDTDLYIQELQEATDAVKSVGSFPIFTTDWMIKNASLVGALQRFADANGSWFHDIGSLGDMLMTVGSPAYRWYGTHPDTRGQAVTWAEMKYFLDRLPKPRKAIKLFRKRADFQASSINDLNYDTLIQRCIKFKEITLGNDAISTADEGLTDKSQSLSTIGTKLTDEYMELLSGNNVAFTTYALIDITLDKIGNTSVNIFVKTAQNASFVFYLKNNLDSGTYPYSVVSNSPHVNIKVSKLVYDAITINSGDTYTTSQVTDGTNPISLVAKGKYYSVTTGYIVGLATASNVIPSVKTTGSSGTLTRTSGTGSSSIVYTSIDANLSNYDFVIIKNMGNPVGSMSNVTSLATYADGYYKIALTAADIAKYVKYDNLKLIVNLPSTSFNISDVYVEYTGGIAKHEEKVWYAPKKSFTEKAPANIFDANWTTTGGWTNNGAVLGAMSSTHKDYPTFASISNHVTLGFDAANNYAPARISQNILITPKYGHRKCVVRAICRVWPKLYRTDLTEDDEVTHTQQITKDSYDFGTLCLAISTLADNPNGTYAIMRHPVSTGWMEAYFEFDIAPWQNGFDLMFYRDLRDVIDTTNYKNHTFDLQLCAWSCMVEGE